MYASMESSTENETVPNTNGTSETVSVKYRERVKAKEWEKVAGKKVVCILHVHDSKLYAVLVRKYVFVQYKIDLIISIGVYKIGSRAFYQWNYLLDIIIGDSVTEIGSNSFLNVNNREVLPFNMVKIWILLDQVHFRIVLN